jgi:hypothetical protein
MYIPIEGSFKYPAFGYATLAQINLMDRLAFDIHVSLMLFIKPILCHVSLSA